MSPDARADEIIAHLNLAPHPEGGFYRQTWVAKTWAVKTYAAETLAGETVGRPSGTCIYFLLKDGGPSHWHRVDATEIWLWHAGAPLVVSRATTAEGPATDAVLGPDLWAGQMPQLIVDEGHWQAARTLGDWTLVSCTVSPGFQFEGFELAPQGFDIPRG